MRFAQVGLGWESGVGLSGKNQILVDSWSGPRPIFPHQKRQTTTATCEPPERSSESVSQKNPSAITNRERKVSKNSCKHRLPQARCLLRPTLLPPLAARLRPVPPAGASPARAWPSSPGPPASVPPAVPAGSAERAKGYVQIGRAAC